jgi:hypothetical protein
MPATDGARSRSSRATPVTLLAIAGALLAARVTLGIVEHVRPVERPDLVEWRDPGAGEAEARVHGKLVLYCFTDERSDPCRQLSREVFGDPMAATSINEHFIPVRVLDSKRAGGHNPPGVEALEARFGVKQLPTLVVVSPDGAHSQIQAGYGGALATRQFLSQATAMVMMPGRGFRMRIGGPPDSIGGGADSTIGR